jgi:methylated-DNA-[protein]-cysteine S-methyltransferase
VTDIEQILGKGPADMPPEKLASLRAEVLAAAERESLIDIAYTTTDSPVGDLLLAATTHGVVCIAFLDRPADAVLEQLAVRVSPRILEAPQRLDAVRRQLDEYFARRRRAFDLPIDLTLARGFRRDVLDATARRVGYGERVTYSEIAAAAGRPAAVRAAAGALANNPVPIVIPCHRVVRRDGALAGYVGGLDRKARLLRLESEGA